MAQFTLSEAPPTAARTIASAEAENWPPRAAAAGGGAARPTLPHRLIRAIDAALRRLYGIGEFTGRPDCLLRIAVARARRDAVLADGRKLRRGAEVLELHLWNERLSKLPVPGGGLGRTAILRRRLAASLCAVADHLAAEPSLARVEAVRARAGFASRRRIPKLLRVAGAYGFETARDAGARRGRRRWGQFWENFFTCGLAWTFNPAALRSDMLLRSHCELWMSRHTFIARYRSGATDAGGRDANRSDRR